MIIDIYSLLFPTHVFSMSHRVNQGSYPISIDCPVPGVSAKGFPLLGRASKP